MRRTLFGFAATLTVFTALALPLSADANAASLGQLKAQLRKAKAARAVAVTRARRSTEATSLARRLQALAITPTVAPLTDPPLETTSPPAATPGDDASPTGETATTDAAAADPTDAAADPAPAVDPTSAADPLTAFLTGPEAADLNEREKVLAASLLADGTVSDAEVSALATREQRARITLKARSRRVALLKRRLARAQQIVNWNRRGNWRPLIKIAAKRYRISPTGLRRLMILESGGRRTAGGTFKGLFQYYPGTWRGSWNPWRRTSIYDGWAQIQATAYAIRHGMGPGHWPNTYPRAF